MPADLIRCNLDLVYPPFRDTMLEVLARCRARGADMFWTSGTRFMSEQAELRRRYTRRLSLQALRKPSPAAKAELHELLRLGAGRAGAPGFSAHQFGIGADCTHDVDQARAGLQPDWEPKNYRVYMEEVLAGGLETGAPYGDLPHANPAGYTSGEQLAPLRAVWVATPGAELDKLHAVWRYLDAH